MRLFTFWSFAPTTYVERLCLKSMVAAGHEVDLYTYDEGVHVPKGVTVRDAAELMPRARVIFHHRSGSPALFSDLFRYAGLRRGLGTWIDADVLLLRNIADLGDHIFGWQDDRLINGAILRLPAESPYFAYIDSLLRARVPLPSHWGLRRKIRQIARACVGRHRRVDQMEWGVVGPLALTHYVKRHGLVQLAQPDDVFYPLRWRDAAAAFDPEQRIEDRLTHRTRAFHLWNAKIRERALQPPPQGSFVQRMCVRYGVEYDAASRVDAAE